MIIVTIEQTRDRRLMFRRSRVHRNMDRSLDALIRNQDFPSIRILEENPVCRVVEITTDSWVGAVTKVYYLVDVLQCAIATVTNMNTWKAFNLKKVG